jgi:hypothetical protein
MSDSQKTRITYKLEPSYDGTFTVRIYSAQQVKTAQEGLAMIKSLYMLEDPDDVSPTIEVTGVNAVDLLLGLEK